MAPNSPYAATVGRGGRIRIPPPVMRALGLEDGEQIVFFPHPDKSAATVAAMAITTKEPKL